MWNPLKRKPSAGLIYAKKLEADALKLRKAATAFNAALRAVHGHSATVTWDKFRVDGVDLVRLDGVNLVAKVL